jgi:hypothetical protein
MCAKWRSISGTTCSSELCFVAAFAGATVLVGFFTADVI